MDEEGREFCHILQGGEPWECSILQEVLPQNCKRLVSLEEAQWETKKAVQPRGRQR